MLQNCGTLFVYCSLFRRIILQLLFFSKDKSHLSHDCPLFLLIKIRPLTQIVNLTKITTLLFVPLLSAFTYYQSPFTARVIFLSPLPPWHFDVYILSSVDSGDKAQIKKVIEYQTHFFPCKEIAAVYTPLKLTNNIVRTSTKNFLTKWIDY